MGLKWDWAVTGYQFAHRTHAETAEICRFAGASSLEANKSFVDGKSEREIEGVREVYEKGGVLLDSFHLPMGERDDIADFYETRRRRCAEQMCNLFEKAAALGTRAVILHPSTNRFNVEDEGLERYLHFMGSSLEVLIPQAEKLGLTIALENMPPGEGGHRPGSSPGHFTRFLKEFGHPALGFCLDTGHAQASGGPEGPAKFLETMGDRLLALHLADNAGDRDSHLAPGRGLVDWKAVFGGMLKLNFSFPACIEAPPFAYGPHQSYSREAWRELIGQTGSLAERCIGDGA